MFPRGGSIVTKKEGSLICQKIKNVGTPCCGVVPYRMDQYSSELSLEGLMDSFNSPLIICFNNTEI